MTPALALLAALGLAASGELARVGQTSITREAFVLRASAMRADRRPVTPDLVVDSLVDEAVLAEEARRERLAADPTVRPRLRSAQRRVLADAVIAAAAASVTPSDAELRASYHATADFARIQLLSYPSAGEAQAARDRLGRGAALAAEAARAKRAQVTADDASAPYLLRVQLEPAVERAVFAARPGELVGPVEAGGEWVVARIVELVVGDEAGFEAARSALVARARGRAGEGVRAHLVSKLRATTAVTVDDPFLAHAKVDEATPAELEHPAARVGGEAIPFAEVAALARALAARSGVAHAGDPAALRRILDGLVADALLARDARDRKLDATPEVSSQLALVERGTLAQAELERIEVSLASEPPDRQPELLRARIRALREATPIRIDRAAVAAAGTLLR